MVDSIVKNIRENQKNPLLSKSECIVEGIVDTIRKGKLTPGSPLPTVNVAVQEFKVARKTVVKAYNLLKTKGYIESRHRLGYFVIDTKPVLKSRVLFLIHSYDPHLEAYYRKFTKTVDDCCVVELFFHHYNIKIFEMIINQNLGRFDLFVISSFDHQRIASIVQRIPRDKVLVVLRNDCLSNSYSSIIQDFYNGTYEALQSGLHLLKKYSSLVLSYPKPKGHSNKLKEGFEKFCTEFNIRNEIVNSIENEEIRKGSAFIVIDDMDLVRLLKICKYRNWTLGKDIGVIAFNETPLKSVIRDGITVISCDFEQLAIETANRVMNWKHENTIIPISLIARNSL
uniref:GntR family transcriptional regulator n=1 Tax=uncultured Draconibacterium sp. TaxID=1573823 RepID=UPI0032171507